MIYVYNKGPPHCAPNGHAPEQVMCSDTAPARAPALSAPPQGAPGRLCACTVVAATATPHLRGEDEAHARQPPLTHTGPHPAPVDAVVAVESRLRAHPTAPAHPTTKFITVPSGALRRVSPPVGGRVARSRRSGHWRSTRRAPAGALGSKAIRQK